MFENCLFKDIDITLEIFLFKEQFEKHLQD